MNTSNLLISLIDDLDKMKGKFIELASQHEFQEYRDEYLKYSENLISIKEKLANDYDNIKDLETHTGILDRI